MLRFFCSYYLYPFQRPSSMAILEAIGLKASTAIPALLGGLAYAIRVAEHSITARLTGGVCGVLTAGNFAPGVSQYLTQYPDMVGGVIFLIGAAGAGIVGTVIGISQDPIGFYDKVMARWRK